MTISTVYIKPYELKQKNENLTLHNVWEKHSDSKSSIQYQPLNQVIISKLKEAEELICISSSSLLSKEILEEISKLAQRGIRIYILANSYEDVYRDFLSDKAIIRVDSDVIGFMVLIDPKPGLETKSGYLTGNNVFEIEGGLSYLGVFNGEQLKEAFHYFIWKFWNAPEEYRGQWEPITSSLRSPFDTYPLINPESFYYNSWEQGYLEDKMINVIVTANFEMHIGFSSYEEYGNLIPIIIDKAKKGVKVSIYTDSNHSHSFIKAFINCEEINFYSIKNLNSFFILVDQLKGFLLNGSKFKKHEVGILLSPKDVQNIQNRLISNQDDIWVFRKQISLEQILGNSIFFENFTSIIQEHEIKECEIVNYGSIKVDNLRQYFEGTIKPELNQEKILARTLIHRWNLEPKLLNPKAKVDPLYEKWEKETSRIKLYVEEFYNYALTIVNERKTLMKSLLGKFFQQENFTDIEKIKMELEVALSSMKLKDFNWSKSSMLLEAIKSYSISLQHQQLELYEKQDFYLKKEEWEKGKKVLEIKQEHLNFDLQQKHNQKRSLELKIAEVGPDIAILLKDKEKYIEELEEELFQIELENENLINNNQIEKKTLAICSFLNGQINKYNTLKKNDKKNFFEKRIKPYLLDEFHSFGKLEIIESILQNNKISDSKELMKYIMKQLATDSELRLNTNEVQKNIISKYEEINIKKVDFEKQLELMRKENQRGNSDVQNDLQQTQKEIIKLEIEINKVKKMIEKNGIEFSYSPSNKRDGSLAFSLNFTVKLPEEELPKTGKLFIVGNKRQLAIKNQDELVIGELESNRLNAELVLQDIVS